MMNERDINTATVTTRRTFSLRYVTLDGREWYDRRTGESAEALTAQLQTMLDRARAGNKAFASMADWQSFELREA